MKVSPGKAIRIAHGLTLADLARHAHTSANWLSMVERDECVPNKDTRHRVGRALGIDPEMLKRPMNMEIILTPLGE